MIYNRIEIVNVTFEQLAADEAKRAEFKTALNEFGQGNWQVVQLQQIAQAMLVFLSKND